MSLQPIGWSTALIATAVSVARGGNSVALKFALRSFSPFWSAFARMSVGVLTVGGWAALSNRTLRPRREEWGPLVSLALLFGVQIGLLHVGLDYTSPAYSAVIMNSNPVYANLIAHFIIPEDRLSWARVAGMATSLAGICFVVLGRPDQALASRPVLGNSVILASAVLVAARTVYTQRLVQRIEGARMVFWQMLLALPYFALMAWMTSEGGREPLSRGPVAAVLYQGVVVAGICFLVWVRLLKKHSPGALSMFNFLVPVFGVLLSAWLHGEHVTWRLVAGGGAVLAGVAAVTGRGPRPIAAE